MVCPDPARQPSAEDATASWCADPKRNTLNRSGRRDGLRKPNARSQTARTDRSPTSSWTTSDVNLSITAAYSRAEHLSHRSELVGHPSRGVTQPRRCPHLEGPLSGRQLARYIDYFRSHTTCDFALPHALSGSAPRRCRASPCGFNRAAPSPLPARTADLTVDAVAAPSSHG